jgi:putative transport protein
MSTVIQVLASSPILTLFLVIGIGYIVGQIPLKGFQVGVAGVLFVGIAVGALDKAISIPEIVPTLGLIIFVYTIGIQSGPAFFASFKKQGARDNLFALAVLVMAAGLAYAIGHLLHWPAARIAGLFSGALTNTPAVAAARDRIIFVSAGKLAPDQLRELADQPIVAFGLAYPVGVIGVLTAFEFVRRIWHFEPSNPAEDVAAIRAQDFIVRNPGIFGQSLGDLLQLHRETGFVVSRVRQGRTTLLPRSDIELSEGDIVVAVGDEDSLERARNIFGEPTDEHIELDRTDLDYRRVFVSSAEVVGRRIGDLDLETTLEATITRVRRGDIDVVPSPDTCLEFGDRIRVITRRANFVAVSQFFGDSIKGTAETDFGSVAIGMVIGVLIGLVPIPLPGGNVVRLGLAGGPLLVALILGKLERTGRINWHIPVSANLTLRQIGLLLFFAGVGTKAGYSFVHTFRANGAQTLLAGACVTVVAALTTLIIAHKLLRIPLDTAMGITSGIHTEPASLTYASELSRSDRPNIGYTTVYPLAMIAKIIIAQLLV